MIAGKMMHNCLRGFGLTIIVWLADWAIYEHWMINKHSRSVWILEFLLKFPASYCSYPYYMGMSSFAGSVADKNYAGTWMTLINSFSNLGGVWQAAFIIYLQNWLSVEFMACVGLVYSIAFYYLTKETLEAFDSMPKELFVMGGGLSPEASRKVKPKRG